MVIWRKAYTPEGGLGVPKAGIEAVHEHGIRFERPRGFGGDHIFICFHNPVEALDPRTEVIRQRSAGACILYQPFTHQFYRATQHQFSHSWFHATGGTIEEIFQRFNIPVGTFFYPRSTLEITQAIRTMVHELDQQQIHWKKRIRLQVQDMALHISRGMRPVRAPTRTRSTVYERIAEVRNRLRHRKDIPTVPAMAREAFLSRSRFSVLYKGIYGISPIQDILDVRLEQGASLLRQKQLSVKEVCEEIGYEDPAYFSRIFRKKFGVPPSRYRG